MFWFFPSFLSHTLIVSTSKLKHIHISFKPVTLHSAVIWRQSSQLTSGECICDIIHLWHASLSMWNSSSHLPGTATVCYRAVSKISHFAKDRNSQNRNVLHISTNILHNPAKMFYLTAAPGLKKKAVPPLDWLLPFSFQRCQDTVEQGAAPEEQHKPRGSCQWLKLLWHWTLPGVATKCTD